MRVRQMDSSGDMVWGSGSSNFLVDSPQCVLQCVLTALRLWQGEWFLDITKGMPWKQKVLGIGTQYDNAIKACILGVQNVLSISAYSSTLNSTTRALSITATITTPFGDIALATSLNFA